MALQDNPPASLSLPTTPLPPHPTVLTRANPLLVRLSSPIPHQTTLKAVSCRTHRVSAAARVPAAAGAPAPAGGAARVRKCLCGRAVGHVVTARGRPWLPRAMPSCVCHWRPCGRPAGRPPVHPHGWMVTAAGGSGQSQLCLGRRRRSAHRGGRRCEACNAGREVWKGQDEQRARAPSAPPWRCGWLWRSDTPADISLVSAAVPPPPKRLCLEVLTVV